MLSLLFLLFFRVSVIFSISIFPCCLSFLLFSQITISVNRTSLLVDFHPEVWEKTFESEVFQLSPPKDKTKRVDRVFSKFFTLPRCRARKNQTKKTKPTKYPADEGTLLSWSQAHEKKQEVKLAIENRLGGKEHGNQESGGDKFRNFNGCQETNCSRWWINI